MQLLLVAVLEAMQVLVLDLRGRDLRGLDELLAGLGDEVAGDGLGLDAVQRMRSPFLLLLLEVGRQVVRDGFLLPLAEDHRQVLDLVPARVQLLGVDLLRLLGAEAELVAGVHELGRGGGLDALAFDGLAGGRVADGAVDQEIAVVGRPRKWLHVPVRVVVVVAWLFDVVGAAFGLVVGVLVVGGADERFVPYFWVLDFSDGLNGREGLGLIVLPVRVGHLGQVVLLCDLTRSSFTSD